MKIKKGSRGNNHTLMIVDIILAVVLIVMAVLAFLDPEENMVLFPFIFFVAAAMRFSDGIDDLLHVEHEKIWKSAGMRDLILGIIILIIGIVASVGIWT